MTCAVEAVFSYSQLLVVLIGQAVKKSDVGHCGVKSRVEYRYHGRIGHNLSARLDSHNIRGIVQRRKLYVFLAAIEHFFVNKHRRLVILRSVNDSVTYGGNFLHARNDSAILARESVQNHLNGFYVGRHIFFEHKFLSVRLVGKHRTVNADSLAKPLGDDAFVAHIDKLILQGRTARIDNQNFHFKNSFNPIVNLSTPRLR